LILDNATHEEIKHNERACIEKSTSKEEIFYQLWQAIANMNEKLDKLTDITQKLKNMLNGIKKRIGQHENKLNYLEEEKAQLRNEIVPKTNVIVFQLDRQEQYLRRGNILIYGAEEDKEDND